MRTTPAPLLVLAASLALSACATTYGSAEPLVATVRDVHTLVLTQGARTSTYATDEAQPPRNDLGNPEIASAHVVPLRADGRESAVLVRTSEGTGDTIGENAALLAAPAEGESTARVLWSAQTRLSTPHESMQTFLWFVDLDGDGRFEIVRDVWHNDLTTHGPPAEVQVFRAGGDGTFVENEALRSRAGSDRPRAHASDIGPIGQALHAAYGPFLVITGARLLGTIDAAAVYGTEVQYTVLHRTPAGVVEQVRAVVDTGANPPRVVRSERVATDTRDEAPASSGSP